MDCGVEKQIDEPDFTKDYFDNLCSEDDMTEYFSSEDDQQKLENMFAAVDQTIAKIRNQEKEQFGIEQIAQMLVYLPFFVRWKFLFSNRKFIWHYFHRNRKNYSKSCLDSIRKLLEPAEYTEEDTLRSCVDGTYAPDYAQVMSLIIKNGNFSKLIEALPLIIARSNSF